MRSLRSDKIELFLEYCYQHFDSFKIEWKVDKRINSSICFGLAIIEADGLKTKAVFLSYLTKDSLWRKKDMGFEFYLTPYDREPGSLIKALEVKLKEIKQRLQAKTKKRLNKK